KPSDIKKVAERYGVRPGSISPNVLQDQIYKHGSLSNEQESVRRRALEHILDSVRIARDIGSRDVTPWFADGSNFPGTANIRARKRWMAEGLKRAHDALGPDQRLLVEYKPFEPAFYHTDIADWGMALGLARQAGPKGRVLVDTGHHYLAQNIEQIVAWLLDEDMIQTVMTAQELYAKAALIDFPSLTKAQNEQRLIDAENTYKDAFSTDVRPAVREWRRARGLGEDPLAAFRESGYMERITRER